MFNHILVVCTGNVCRSPVGAALLKQHFPEKNIECAGLDALVGQGVERLAAELCEADGLDVSDHKGRRLTQEMLGEADLILVMTEKQRRAIAEKAPVLMGKIMLFGQWLPNRQTAQQGVEIPDPYKKSREAFAHVYQLMKQAADAWRDKLG